MLRLLLGRAGAGKTETCLRESLRALADGGPGGVPLVLLAPEQSTYQLERALLDRQGPGTALARLQVLSFERLAASVLAETGAAAKPYLGPAGRRMALRTALRALRPRLAVFGASADRPGCAEAVARQIDEFASYRLAPEGLRTLAALAPSDTAARLSDLAAVWDAYRARLGDRVREPGAELSAAAAAIPDSTYAQAGCWVDGFSGFTPLEESVLAAWLASGAQLHVALCLDPDDDGIGSGELDPLHPFAPTRATLGRLLSLARRAGLPPPAIERLRPLPPARFAASPDLAALEAGLWPARARRALPETPAVAGHGGRNGPRADTRGAGGHGAEGRWAGPEGTPPADPADPADPAVRLHAAADARAEAEACAAEIDRLCRTEGFRYREVAVILRDLDTYRGLLAVACARRSIPLFVDARRPAARHPAAHALLAAVRVVAVGWSTDAVRTFLQGDLSGLEREEADALDLLATARGASGEDWFGDRPLARPAGTQGSPSTGELGGAPLPGADPETARRRMARPLRALQQALQTAGSAREAARACFRFLEALDAPARVAAWIRAAEDARAFDLAAWHRQCWDAVVGVLDEVGLALGEADLPPPDLAAALDSGLEGLTVGLVPPGLDQVLCTGVARSRHPAVRVAFVLGMGDGLFPAPAREGGLLGDADRLALRDAGHDLGPTAAERWMHERYLAYVALTRASERLYLSYPAAAGPAQVLARVRAAVPSVGAWGPPDGPDACPGVVALAGEVAARLRAGPATAPWRAAAAWLRADPRRLREAERVWAGLDPGPAPRLPAALAARLYPDAFSPTRLETMAACPFQHFARYGLQLREREQARVEPGDLGRLLHAALAAFVQGILDDGLDWARLDEREAAARSAGALARQAPNLRGRLPRGSARAEPLLRAAGRDLERGVAAMIAHARSGGGRYQPVGVEVALTGGLTGFIDRLDEAWDAAGEVHVRVVDYKTGSAPFRLDAFVDGVDLAPVLYLADALAARGGQAVPGGLFTFPVRDERTLVPGPQQAASPGPRLEGLAAAEAEALALHEAAGDGAVTGVRRTKDGSPYKGAPVARRTQFALLLRAARRRVDGLSADARAGLLAPHPYRTQTRAACAVCAFLDVCRFDPSRGGRYRWARRGEPWALLAAEEGAEGAAAAASATNPAGGANATANTPPQGDPRRAGQTAPVPGHGASAQPAAGPTPPPPATRGGAAATPCNAGREGHRTPEAPASTSPPGGAGR